MTFRPSATLATLAAMLAAGACASSPVEWDEPRSSARVEGQVTVSAEGVVSPDSMAVMAARIAPPPGPVCPGSLALARGGRTLFAVWWAVRPDSGARLLAARSSDDGATWSVPVPVDTTDAGASACARTPASIAADSATGYVHVAYALQAREGPGLFFSHSMDGGQRFHEPVPIFYGERLGRASVAADGDVVAVAFEDPNSARPSIGLALSRTMGHIFEARLLSVSDGSGMASRPLAAVRGRRVAVAWLRRAAADSGPAVLAVRTGTLP